MNERLTSVTVFGILNLVFGIIGLIGVAFSVAMFLIPKSQGFQNPALDMMWANESYLLFANISLFLGTLATLVLLIAGVGLLRMKPWGRLLSIGYAVYAILSGIVGMFANFFFINQPMLESVQLNGSGPEQAGVFVGVIAGAIGRLISLIYPALLLYFMSRPNVKAAFLGVLTSNQTEENVPPLPSLAPPVDSDNPYDSPQSS